MILSSNSEGSMRLMFDLPGLATSHVVIVGDSSPRCLPLRRPAELGLADIGTTPPDPALFGYTLEHVLERLAVRATAGS
jgi:hypothetical protein